MQWLTGHWEWHAISSYVVVPLDGEPTLVFSMGGTHAEACRRECANALTDVRHSRNGRYAEVMVERLKELKLERGRIGLVEIDARHNDYLPVNQYNVLRQSLPDAELVFTKGFLHELVVIHSEEELRCVRKAGVLCQRAMEAMIARAKPGVPEYELRAAAGAAILDGGGDIDFLIIGTTPMDEPGHGVRQSAAVAPQAASRATSSTWSSPPATTASPRRSARRSRSVRRPTWCASSGTRSRCRATRRSSPRSGPAMPPTICGSRAASSASKGVQSRPTQVHGIDIVTDKPHVFAERTEADEIDKVLKPGMIIMAEPNPITRGRHVRHLPRPHLHRDADGHECVDGFPLEIAVAAC